MDEALVAKAEMLSQENVQLQATVEGLEKERDFYFEKLVRFCFPPLHCCYCCFVSMVCTQSDQPRRVHTIKQYSNKKTDAGGGAAAGEAGGGRG